MKMLPKKAFLISAGVLSSLAICSFSIASTLYYKDGTELQNVSDVRKIGDSFLYKLNGKDKSVFIYKIAKIIDDNGNLFYEPSELIYTKKWDEKKGYVYTFKKNNQVIATGYWDENDCFAIDSGSLLNGLYNENYDSGALRSTLSANNGNLNGVCRFYYDSGKLKREGTFVNGKEEGISKLYDNTGVLEGTSEYKNGKKNGTTQLLYTSGKTKALLNYKDGNIEGVQKTFYESGQVQTVVNFENGVRNGHIEEYYENGKLMMKGDFVNDNLNGQVIQYYESGRVKSTKLFDNGKLVK